MKIFLPIFFTFSFAAQASAKQGFRLDREISRLKYASGSLIYQTKDQSEIFKLDISTQNVYKIYDGPGLYPNVVVHPVLGQVMYMVRERDPESQTPFKSKIYAFDLWTSTQKLLFETNSLLSLLSLSADARSLQMVDRERGSLQKIALLNLQQASIQPTPPPNYLIHHRGVYLDQEELVRLEDDGTAVQSFDQCRDQIVWATEKDKIYMYPPVAPSTEKNSTDTQKESSVTPVIHAGHSKKANKNNLLRDSRGKSLQGSDPHLVCSENAIFYSKKDLGGNRSLVRLDLETGEERRVPTHGPNPRWPAYNPKSQTLYFTYETSTDIFQWKL